MSRLVCECCDHELPPDDEGKTTLDHVFLCTVCHDECAADPLNHSDECECEDCQ